MTPVDIRGGSRLASREPCGLGAEGRPPTTNLHARHREDIGDLHRGALPHDAGLGHHPVGGGQRVPTQQRHHPRVPHTPQHQHRWVPGDRGAEGRDPGAHPPAVCGLSAGTRPPCANDETNAGTGPSAGVAGEQSRPQPHRGCLVVDGAMDPGQRRWLAQEGRGPQNKGPRSLGCDSLGIVPGIDPVLPDPRVVDVGFVLKKTSVF